VLEVSDEEIAQQVKYILYVARPDGKVKGELLYSLIKVETDLGCSYVDGGIGSL